MSVTTTENICRTCLSRDGELISLFSGTASTTGLTSKIMNISDLTINKHDGMPHMICKKCIFLVESFNCFKKQILSANKKIEKIWRVTWEKCQTEEDDSDYEVQYISDEVKRKVQNAFRRKRDTARKLIDSRTSSEKIPESNPTSIEPEMAKSADWAQEKINMSCESSCHGNGKDAEKNVTLLSRKCGEETKHANSNATEKEPPCNSSSASVSKSEITNKPESENFQTGYSNYQARLVIDTEEPQDQQSKESKSEGEEDNWIAEEGQGSEALKCTSEQEKNSELDTMGNVLWKSFNSIRDKYFKPAETSRTDFSNDKDEADLELGKQKVDETGCSKFENSASERVMNVESCSTESIHRVTSLPDKVNQQEPAVIETEVSGDRCGDVEDPTSIESSLSVREEIVESERFGENANEAWKIVLCRVEEERMDTHNDYRSDVQHEIPDSVKHQRQANRDLTQTIVQPAKQLITVKKCYDKKFDDRSDTHEKISMDNVTSGAETCVIVISSDSSDDQRHQNTACRKQRKPRKKLFQTRLLPVRKGLKEKRASDKDCAKDRPTNVQSKLFQPRKYFQCTSCNVNLYSVSAVLHHHNQIHTPPQELMHCMMCDVKFPSKTILRAHFDQHVESHLFRCSYCTCEFVLRRNLRAHMNAHALAPQIEEQPEPKRQRITDAELPTQNDLSRNNEVPLVMNPNATVERT